MNIGHIYLTHSNYPEALKTYLDFLRLSEEIKDEVQIARAHGCIGMVYMKQGEYPKAIEHFFTTVEIQKRLNRAMDLSKTYNFIANTYDEMGKFSDALRYHDLSLKVKEKIGDEEGIGVSYQNIAGALTDLKRYDEALEYYHKAMALHKKYNRTESIIRTYISLSKLYVLINNVKAAEEVCLKALELDNGADLEIGLNIHQNLSHIYELKKEFAKAMEHFKKHIAIRDSLLNEENIKKSVKLEMNYEFDKKEAKTQAEQEKKDALSKAESKKQRLVIWSVSLILILVLVFAIYAYRSFLGKQRSNKEITSQKEIIEQKQKEILDSIHYARRIQSSLMSSETYIDKNIRKLKS